MKALIKLLHNAIYLIVVGTFLLALIIMISLALEVFELFKMTKEQRSKISWCNIDDAFNIFK